MGSQLLAEPVKIVHFYEEGSSPLIGLQAAAAQYAKEHAGVEIAFERLSSDLLFADFVKAVGQSPTPPDLIQCFAGWAKDLGGHGNLIMRLTGYLDLESPYAKGKAWKDTLDPNLLEGMRDEVYGDVWSLPFASVTVRVFANLDLLDQVGVDVPETWGEFLSAHEALKKAGHVPCVMVCSPPPGPSEWVLQSLIAMLLQNRVSQWDSRDGDGRVDQYEMLAAGLRGDLSLQDEEVMESLRLLRSWADFWQEGFDQESPSTALEKFAQGGVGFYVDSMARWKTLNDRVAAQGQFALGAFAVPRVTEADSAFADGGYFEKVDSTGLEMAIPSIIEKFGGDKLKRAVDILQFITSPAGQALIVSNGWLMPSGLGIPMPPEFDPFRPRLSGGAPLPDPLFLSEELKKMWLGEGRFNKFLKEPWNPNQFIQEMQPIFRDAMKTSVPREIRMFQGRVAYQRGAYTLLEPQMRVAKAKKDERLVRFIEGIMRRTWWRLEEKQDTLSFLSRENARYQETSAPPVLPGQAGPAGPQKPGRAAKGQLEKIGP